MLDGWNVGRSPATLPAQPGDVGQGPLSIPRQMPCGERRFEIENNITAQAL